MVKCINMANEKEISELQKYLRDEDYKSMMVFCIEPKSWDEIKKLKIRPSKLFQIIKDLKMSRALEFADGKYYAAEFTKVYIK